MYNRLRFFSSIVRRFFFASHISRHAHTYTHRSGLHAFIFIHCTIFLYVCKLYVRQAIAKNIFEYLEFNFSKLHTMYIILLKSETSKIVMLPL